MFLNIFFDVILVTILIGGSSYGYNKGLFKMTIGPARLILCVALSLTYCGVVGSYIVIPIAQEVFKDSSLLLINSFISPISTAVAFGLLFLIVKTVFSFIVSLINRLLEKGIVGRINSALGLVLAGSIAFLTAISVAYVSEFLFAHEAFMSFTEGSDFTGGPLYRFFLLISPRGLIFTN